MQSKIFGGIFALIWSGACYQAGRISQKQHKQSYPTNKIHLQHPSSTQLFKNNKVNDDLISQSQLSTQASQTLSTKSSQTSIQTKAIASSINKDTFIDGIISPPFRNVNYPNFKILYSTYHKCPLAVHQKFNKQLADGDAPRRPTFFNQELVQKQFQSTNDHFIKSGAYKNFNYARGHMAAAGNYSGNKNAKFQTFTYANVVPQNQYNNGGIWNTFERYSRDLVMSGKCESVQVISGPIYDKNGVYVGENGQKYENVYKQQSKVLLKDGIAVPQKLYKIIKCNTRLGEEYMDGFEFWNKKTFDNDKSLKQFRTTLVNIQNQTGLKFNFNDNKDKLNGSRIIKSLIQYDKQGFESKKKQYDEKFYSKLMSRSSSIDDMNNSFMRAKQQRIFINLQIFRQQSIKLFKQDLQSIKLTYSQSGQKVACQTLNKLIKLNKNLQYLRLITQQQKQQIKKVQNGGPLIQCKQKSTKLRLTQWQQFNKPQYNEQLLLNEKKQKIALNSLTYSITKSINKQQQIQSLRAAPKVVSSSQTIKAAPSQSDKVVSSQGSLQQYRGLSYVNEKELRDFIIAVNIATSISDKQVI